MVRMSTALLNICSKGSFYCTFNLWTFYCFGMKRHNFTGTFHPGQPCERSEHDTVAMWNATLAYDNVHFTCLQGRANEMSHYATAFYYDRSPSHTTYHAK